jgi:isopentenyl-diphosphate delta-isomerase
MANDKELITIVDDNDVAVGEEEKGKCHDGAGILHRAFLAMAFNAAGELCLTRRSHKKRLWPGFWDGSVASHLHRDEDYVQASQRRLEQELGLPGVNAEYAFKFRYRADYLDQGTEQEICAVTIIRGVDFAVLRPDPDEISEIRTVDLKVLIEEIRENSVQYTPWLILALEHMSEKPIRPVREFTVQPIPC